MKVVSDSTVLIGLSKIGKINLLKGIFKEISIPEAVYSEVVIRGKGRPGVREVEKAKWILRKTIKNKRMVNMLTAEMGRGEAEVLTLGSELNADWVLMDDEKGRTAALSAGFKVIGVAGIFVLAKQLKLIPSVKPLLDELEKKNFRLSDKIRKGILKKAGEK